MDVKAEAPRLKKRRSLRRRRNSFQVRIGAEGSGAVVEEETEGEVVVVVVVAVDVEAKRAVYKVVVGREVNVDRVCVFEIVEVDVVGWRSRYARHVRFRDCDVKVADRRDGVRVLASTVFMDDVRKDCIVVSFVADGRPSMLKARMRKQCSSQTALWGRLEYCTDICK